jgi:hypothetical protein
MLTNALYRIRQSRDWGRREAGTSHAAPIPLLCHTQRPFIDRLAAQSAVCLS